MRGLSIRCTYSIQQGAHSRGCSMDNLFTGVRRGSGNRRSLAAPTANDQTVPVPIRRLPPVQYLVLPSDNLVFKIQELPYGLSGLCLRFIGNIIRLKKTPCQGLYLPLKPLYPSPPSASITLSTGSPFFIIRERLPAGRRSPDRNRRPAVGSRTRMQCTFVRPGFRSMRRTCPQDR